MPRIKGNSNFHLKEGNEDGKPKNKMNAYAFFVQTCREEHKRKHPDEIVEFTEFSKKCAERWKTMSDREKKRFQQLAEGDRRRFETEMASFASSPNEKSKKGRKKKKIKDPNAPKRSMSAFFWFSQEARPKVKEANPNFSVGEIAKELGRRWSEAPAEMKAKFEALAEKDRDRYTQEKKSYQHLQQQHKSGESVSNQLALSDNEDELIEDDDSD